MRCRIGRSDLCSKHGCEWIRLFKVDCKDPIFSRILSLAGKPYSKKIKKKRRSNRHRSNKFGIKKRLVVYLKSNGICYLCKTELNCKTFTVDHVIPRSKGGSNEIFNLRAAHKKCNSSKSDKVL